MTENTDALLQAILSTVGRAAFDQETIKELVNPQGRNQRNLQAYNLADGTRTQADIVKQLNLDRGNFSRTVTRWINAGVMFRLPDNTLIHIYPINNQ